MILCSESVAVANTRSPPTGAPKGSQWKLSIQLPEPPTHTRSAARAGAGDDTSNQPSDTISVQRVQRIKPSGGKTQHTHRPRSCSDARPKTRKMSKENSGPAGGN